MLSKSRKIYLESTAWLRHLWGRLRLRNRRVSVISNDCWGSFMSHYYNFPFHSPFVGLFIKSPDYIRILENPALIDGPLRFIDGHKSKYRHIHSDSHTYPVGVLADDIEVHFLHYRSEQEAREKWTRRARRIDWSNAVVKMSQDEVFRPEFLERFDRLPYPVKVCFTTAPHPEYPSACMLPDARGDDMVRSSWRISEVAWSFVKHANSLLTR